MRLFVIVRASVALAIAAQLPAQTQATSPWAIDTVRSTVLGTARPVFIATPADYASSTERYPVLVLLDADDRPQFTLAVAHAAFLASRGMAPPLIIVGVPNGADRSHDLTPPATGSSKTFAPTAGGAHAFAEFIEREVVPFVRAKYRTLPTTLLAGHSYGGLFALDVATTPGQPFVGIIAMSPSLWWNDTTGVVRYADALAASHQRLRLFATSGALEPPIDGPTRRFAARIDSLKPASLAFGYRGYPDDTHRLTPDPSFADGLRFIFAPIALANMPIATLTLNSDSTTLVRGVLETERQYADAARSLGLPEQLPEDALNQLGYNVVRAPKLVSVAVWIFHQNVAQHPASANVYDSLGDGYLAARDTAAAIMNFRKSVDVARQGGVAPAKETLDKLAALTRSRER